jgi:hypothetical protein
MDAKSHADWQLLFSPGNAHPPSFIRVLCSYLGARRGWSIARAAQRALATPRYHRWIRFRPTKARHHDLCEHGTLAVRTHGGNDAPSPMIRIEPAGSEENEISEMLH